MSLSDRPDAAAPGDPLHPDARDLQGGRRRTVALPGRPGGALSVLEWDGPPGYDPAAPVLVWLHATGFHALTYRRLLIDLAGHLPVIAVDQRGHGLTTLPAQPGRMNVHGAYFADAVALLEGLGRPAIMAGHSLGSIVSTGLAGRRPDLVRGLLLAEPVLLKQSRLTVFAIARALGQADRVSPLSGAARRRRAIFPSRAAMLEAYTGRGAFKTWPRETLEDYVAAGARERPDGQVELSCTPDWEAETFNGLPARMWRWIAGIRCPITLLRGGVRSTCAEAPAARLKAMHPRTREVFRPQASHFLPQEEPGLVVAEILRLAAALPGAPAALAGSN